MAETHDTIKGLLAEFRGYAAGMPPSYHVTMSWHDFRVMLDRLDAAHKREVDMLARLVEELRSQCDMWYDKAEELRTALGIGIQAEAQVNAYATKTVRHAYRQAESEKTRGKKN